jgi:hypothetical protein
MVRTCLAHVARWFLFPLNVYLSIKLLHNSWNFISIKNEHELVIYASRTRGFDERIFVVRTVNKLPQAKHLLILEQSLDLASMDQGLHGVIIR